VGDEPEITPGGSEVQRHDELRPPEPVPGGWAGQELIENHVERHVGPIANVFHELYSEYIHLDVLVVEAREERPWHTLVTSGMSSRPMEDGTLMELLIGLPPTWPLDREAWQDERHYWPVRALKELARLPHMYGFSLGDGHTVPNGDPPEPYGPGTRLCGALIAPPLVTPNEPVEGAEDTLVRAVYFLYEDEMDLKLKRGFGALADAFDDAEITEVVEPDRPSTVKKKRFGLF
jgi:Suppressor of fused protein (SUFU)